MKICRMQKILYKTKDFFSFFLFIFKHYTLQCCGSSLSWSVDEGEKNNKMSLHFIVILWGAEFPKQDYFEATSNPKALNIGAMIVTGTSKQQLNHV